MGAGVFCVAEGREAGDLRDLCGGPNRLDVTAEGFTEATQPLYAAAFDAVLPQAVKAANDLRALASRPKR